MSDLDVIGDALTGDRGPDQQRIANEGLKWLCLILRKNADYGGSAWQTPILAPGMDAGIAIRIRMSDKIARLNQLFHPGSQTEVDEPIEDTIRDLGAYCLLYLVRP